MSTEVVKMFYERVEQDERLQKRVKNVFQVSQSELQKNIIELGAASGYDFNQEDLEKTFEANIASLQEDELDETELEAVSGGSAVILLGGLATVAIATVPAMTLAVAFAGASVVNKINNGN